MNISAIKEPEIVVRRLYITFHTVLPHMDMVVGFLLI